MATKKSATGRVTPKKTVTQGAADGQPTSASAWKAQTVSGTLVTVPSGNTAMIRTPGMAVFLEAGVIPNSLLPLVQDLMTQPGKGKRTTEVTDEEAASMLDDPQKIQDIVLLADAVVVYCCLEPAVRAIPFDAEGEKIPVGDPRRSNDVLYVDEVDFNDKMYIFAAATGGVAAFERFLQKQGADVGSVSE